MQRVILFLFFIFISLSVFSQDAQRPKYKHSIGVNVTSLLAQVISIGDNNTNDKFNLIYTNYGQSINFRIGANATYSEGTSFFNTTGNTKLTDQAYKIRIGFEKRNALGSKFYLGYGADIFGLFSASDSDSDAGFKVSKANNGIGLGPVLRFEYFVSNKISFMTESTFYFAYGKKSDDTFVNGQLQNSNSSTYQNFETTIPSVLYLNIHF